MNRDRINYKNIQLIQVIKALVPLLAVVLIVACAVTEEKATTLPVTATSISASPTTESITEFDFVAFGDSRTRSATWPDLWIKYIENEVGVPVNFQNWAFNGRPSEEILAALRENEKVINDVREAEIITVFTTDQIGIETFTLNRNLEECPNEAYKKVLEEIMQEIFSIRDGKNTIIRLFEHYNFPGVTERSLVHFEAKNRCIKIYNEVVHSIANKYNIPVVPIYGAFNGPEGIENPGEKGYLRDGIHTNPSGDAVIAKLLNDLGYDPVESAILTDTRLATTTAATSTISPPAIIEIATPTDPQPSPVIPISAELIEPGQQEAFSFKSSSGEEIIFWIYLPEDYEESQKWPLILSLHGFLGFEPSLEKVRGQSPLAWVSPDVEFPFIVIAPQAPAGSWVKYHEPMNELIEYLSESISIDPDAQFITGLSAGAVGVWQWALALPDRFTGAAPISGGPSINPDNPVPDNICLLKDLPLWIANSEADKEVPIEPSLELVKALEECGSTVVHFTIYKDLNHADSISTSYAGPELYAWMLELME